MTQLTETNNFQGEVFTERADQIEAAGGGTFTISAGTAEELEARGWTVKQLPGEEEKDLRQHEITR